MARLIYRLGNDGSEDVDIVGINDGDELSATEAVVITLKTLRKRLERMSEQLDLLR